MVFPILRRAVFWTFLLFPILRRTVWIHLTTQHGIAGCLGDLLRVHLATQHGIAGCLGELHTSLVRYYDPSFGGFRYPAVSSGYLSLRTVEADPINFP